MENIKRAPKNLKDAGRRFWKDVLRDFILEKRHDFELLSQACECLDRMEECREKIIKDGLFQQDRYSRPVEHDAAKIERAQKRLFLSLIREMGLTLQRTESQQRRRLY